MKTKRRFLISHSTRLAVRRLAAEPSRSIGIGEPRSLDLYKSVLAQVENEAAHRRRLVEFGGSQDLLRMTV